MNVHSRIISYNNDDNSFVVRYWTDVISEMTLASFFDNQNRVVMDSNGYPQRCRTDYNITIYNKPDPTKEDIDKLIKNQAPKQWLYITEQKAIGNIHFDLSNVSDMIGQENIFTVIVEDDTANSQFRYTIV